MLEAAGNADEAVRIYQEVQNSAPPECRAPAITGLGRNAERNKNTFKARDLYRQALAEAPWDSEDWNEALDALGRLNVALIFSPQESPESKRYSVQKGDSITSIGNALNTTQGLLMRANGIDENTTLNLGQQLKYTPKEFRIVIERSRCRLFLLDKDGIFRRYPVGLGKSGHETTLGSYKIGNKEKNPVWHKPGAGAIPAGDPANELGTRWMPLVPDQEGLPRDLGIHGTIHPETVGQYSSNGCPRLFGEDVEELYDLVVRSTPVDIVERLAAEDLRAATNTERDSIVQERS
jgi:lipoprotein-anchoring transpeptidase ErfK/SrfK